jgi:outer membrane biosynthesis protein TonB
MKDGQIQTVSMIGTAVFSAAMFLPLLYLTEEAQAKKPDFGEMESIEASIAYKKTPMKQPQKPKKEREPDQKPEGVSHDDKKPPPASCQPVCKTGYYCDKASLTCKEVKKTTEPVDPLKKYKHNTGDEDDQLGKPTTQPGDFNGNEHGWAPQTKGHPFWQKFAQDIHENFKFPTISEDNGIPVGCFHITPDGKIADTKFKEHSQSADLDRAAHDAIDAVKKIRNDNPVPVPNELLGATSRWICFRFDPRTAG